MKSQLAVGFSLFSLLAGPGLGLGADLRQLPLFKNYTNHRVSSYDRTGANDDGNGKNALQPQETRTLAEIEGPAIITHIWVTIATPETLHLKKLVLRMYWDGEPTPSVEAPVGDFFGLGLGQYVSFETISRT
jgi:hypothetical protein